MAEQLVSEQRSRTMRAVRSKQTKLETAVTRSLWRQGFRFRKNVTKLFGKPDIAIQKYKVVIFIDSCFWHGCPLHCRMPKSNQTYWHAKIERNRKRDAEVTRYYQENGWRILRVWEHEIKEDFDGTLRRMAQWIEEAKNAPQNGAFQS